MIIYKILRGVPRSDKQEILRILVEEKRRMRREPKAVTGARFTSRP
jgi:hypothetical protein